MLGCDDYDQTMMIMTMVVVLLVVNAIYANGWSAETAFGRIRRVCFRLAVGYLVKEQQTPAMDGHVHCRWQSFGCL